MRIEDTGTTLTARLKRISKKQATDKSGQPYEKYSFEVAYFPDGKTEPDDIVRSWVTTPPRHPMPELIEGRFYNFPVSYSAGKDGSLFIRLRTNHEIQPVD